jgi:hypothetical protein
MFTIHTSENGQRLISAHHVGSFFRTLPRAIDTSRGILSTYHPIVGGPPAKSPTGRKCLTENLEMLSRSPFPVLSVRIQLLSGPSSACFTCRVSAYPYDLLRY